MQILNNNTAGAKKYLNGKKDNASSSDDADNK